MGSDWISKALGRVLVVAVTGLLLPAAASAAPPPVGGLRPLPGASGCFAGTATPGSCQSANGILRPESGTVSPDGKFVYVGSYPTSNNGTAGLAAFARNPQTGALTPLSDTSGCYTPDGSSLAGPGTCTRVEGIGNGDGRDFAITSDGRWAYMVNQGLEGTLVPPAAIVIFRRDPATGALTQLAAPNGCISHNGSSQDGAGVCQTLATLGSPNGITISSDDRFVYVTDYGSSTRAILVLARDATTGALTEVQCLSDATTTPAGCTAGRQLGVVQALVISPDGLHAYAANFNQGLSIFDRDPQTGLLTQKTGIAGCINDGATNGCASGRALDGAYAIRITPDGHTLFVTAQNSGGVAVFRVNADGTLTQPAGSAGCVTLTGADSAGASTCATGRALEEAYGDVLSPDGRTLYVSELGHQSGEGGVAVFSVDPATGALTQFPGTAGCITADGESNGVAGACATGGPAVANAYTPDLSPDGTSLYLASYFGASLTTFAVEPGPTCQSGAASTAYQTPVTVSLSCTDADGDPVTTQVVAGPVRGRLGAVGSTVTYTPAAGYTGTDSFTFDASDGANTTTPATVTITVGPPPAATPPLLAPPPKPPAVVTHATQSHRRWRESNHGGTTFSFTLNETARVTFTFTQHDHKDALGRLTIAGHAGRNKLAFIGAVNRHTKLKPGTYTVTITAGTSPPRRLTFTIVN
jgi:hypothetical protein